MYSTDRHSEVAIVATIGRPAQIPTQKTGAFKEDSGPIELNQGIQRE